jgi:hypothetical protein
VTWLGGASDDSDLLLEQIANLSGLLDREMQGNAPREMIQTLRNWSPPDDFISLPALSALTKRPYWCRVWVQQELQASKNVWFHCGRKRIHMSLIHLLFAQLEKMRAKLRQQ